MRTCLIILTLGISVIASAQTVASKTKQASDYVASLTAPLKPTTQIVYKIIGDRELQLHVFRPAAWQASDKRPCYIAIHGGGWTGMGPERMYPFADHYSKLGFVGLSLQYRLANAKTGVTVFDCVKDARSAVRYARAHAREFGIDPQKIIVSGGSAGGHLAVSTAMFDTVNEDGEDTVVPCTPNALILLFPVIDTSKEGYGNAKIGDRWKDLSPAHNVRAGLPPTLTFHGTGDTVCPFKGAQSFHNAMVKAGNHSELIVNEGGAHGYLMRTQSLFDECLAKSDAFLKSLKLIP